MNARTRLPILHTPGMPARFHRLRFVEAGANDGTPGAPAGNGDNGAAAGSTPPAPPAPPAAPVPTPPKASTGTFSQEYVSELREESKAARIKAQEAETQVATLTKRAEDAEKALADLQTAGNLDKAIAAASGNGIALLAVKGAGVLNGVDLTDQAKVDAAVKAFIDEHPELKAAPTATRSTVPSPGGPGEGGQRPTSIRDALARASQ
ncbi:hypothetical protein [Xylanimonas ulmi]|uniref:Scaffolding protein n=1 Tax=Xylanimonas ulmi TaxID=228973 RepID=A0A4Q7M6I0_9MICO|nr:hypothetical protein [Xylanibacterium ulmi]RZS61679.1 hypothetical protein EV386_1989 [Xylanibacterium ulmi]